MEMGCSIWATDMLLCYHVCYQFIIYHYYHGYHHEWRHYATIIIAVSKWAHGVFLTVGAHGA